MKATTRMLGDIKAKRLTVEDGVTFVGRSEVNPSGASAPAAPRPAAEKPVPPADKPEDRGDEPKGTLFGKNKG
jgi:cytoskeletal protein CcmA (bactofilin family)